jgi:hypothetical protein
MNTKLILVAVLLIVVIGAYYVFSMYKDKAPTEADIAGAVITMSTNPSCMNPNDACHRYSVRITGDGKVSYSWRTGRATSKSGTLSAQITGEQWKDLVNAFYERKFFALNDRYPEGTVNDGGSATVSFTIGGKTKEVVAIVGTPESLKFLMKKINDTVSLDTLISKEQ